jgi:hypothetical protein
MASQAQRVFKSEMDLARGCYTARQWAQTIHHLERAHIVGQRYFWGHLVSHLWMLRVAWARRDLRELRGQLTRILAVPLGYGFGWVPVGNTGGANVSPIQPMPIPQDLQSSFVGYSLQRQILWRVLLFAGLALAALAVSAWAPAGAASAAVQPGPQPSARLADFGSTRTLEIITAGELARQGRETAHRSRRVLPGQDRHPHGAV